MQPIYEQQIFNIVFHRCLHGQWYRGQLVTAKYLRLERFEQSALQTLKKNHIYCRYHERFPDSKKSFVPMRPAN